MNIKITQNDYPDLIQRLQTTKQTLKQVGEEWSRRSIQTHHHYILDNLKTQGRTRKPKLSDATLKLYKNLGEPDGSGIRNHIEITFIQQGHTHRAILGIPEGKPTMVAKVQEYGAQIKVTDKMRRFLAANGIFLRADTLYITIPGRQFWSLANEKAKEEAKQLLKQLLKESGIY